MLSKKNHIEIDSLDTKILTILAKDAKLSYAEIGKMLYVSPGTVHVRVKKLTEANLIKAVRAELNYAALGFDITAFLGIYLEKSNMYESVKSELKKIPEVIDAHYTTGNYSIFAKIICRDTEHLRDILAKKLQAIKGIQRTETFISLEETLSRPLYLAEI
ncbi:MAG TPA: Lrp/AsnC ligand binding domain-containing protein [Saprospiraceae bacterium]|jgi:Lrp/AsnC family transcriptional regulator for asnA, asnC and gidA|nr:Lrp/AsnC ligand binding domain-containing protein [Saprospiraceae bacterium]MBK8826257.1 Lrp/AsnC ligand binding domain-containing protein [Saprospiraceae bacterium]MBK8888272.1 Lrp/AsnC ligand binding domain-containing protein [Saprospiraceae bacterium]MBK9741724.1 Lrp/AsnC ligand binding domain-containing protein [Saprospiraceae bacterium]MBP6538848.1 Lrp/AsnC ligand binding domain-containing protein [Saprospiraceae bacterium]